LRHVAEAFPHARQGTILNSHRIIGIATNTLMVLNCALLTYIMMTADVRLPENSTIYNDTHNVQNENSPALICFSNLRSLNYHQGTLYHPGYKAIYADQTSFGLSLVTSDPVTTSSLIDQIVIDLCVGLSVPSSNYFKNETERKRDQRFSNHPDASDMKLFSITFVP